MDQQLVQHVMPFVVGLAVILSNIGARYINLSIPRKREKMLAHPAMRYVYIFCMGFVGTHSIQMSTILAGLYALFINY